MSAPRAVPKAETIARNCRPYVVDLASVNGTFLNGERIEAQGMVELREKDVLKFANSTREYVFLAEDSSTS